VRCRGAASSDSEEDEERGGVLQPEKAKKRLKQMMRATGLEDSEEEASEGELLCRVGVYLGDVGWGAGWWAGDTAGPGPQVRAQRCTPADGGASCGPHAAAACAVPAAVRAVPVPADGEGDEESESLMDEDDLDRMAGGSGAGVASARQPTPETQRRPAVSWLTAALSVTVCRPTARNRLRDVVTPMHVRCCLPIVGSVRLICPAAWLPSLAAMQEGAAAGKKRKSPTPPPASAATMAAAGAAAAAAGGEQGTKRPRTAPAEAPAAVRPAAPASAPAAGGGSVTAEELKQLLRSKGRILVSELTVCLGLAVWPGRAGPAFPLAAAAG
jgi:hypothetical protein